MEKNKIILLAVFMCSVLNLCAVISYSLKEIGSMVF